MPCHSPKKENKISFPAPFNFVESAALLYQSEPRKFSFTKPPDTPVRSEVNETARRVYATERHRKTCQGVKSCARKAELERPVGVVAAATFLSELRPRWP